MLGQHRHVAQQHTLASDLEVAEDQLDQGFVAGVSDDAPRHIVEQARSIRIDLRQYCSMHCDSEAGGDQHQPLDRHAAREFERDQRTERGADEDARSTQLRDMGRQLRRHRRDARLIG